MNAKLLQHGFSFFLKRRSKFNGTVIPPSTEEHKAKAAKQHAIKRIVFFDMP